MTTTPARPRRSRPPAARPAPDVPPATLSPQSGERGPAASAADQHVVLPDDRRPDEPAGQAPGPPGRRRDAERASYRRMRRRRRRTSVVSLLLVAAGLVGADLAQGGSRTGQPAPRLAVEAVEATPSVRPASLATIPPGPVTGPVVPLGSPPAAATSAPRRASYPMTGPGTFGYATGQGRVLGVAGMLRRFQVAVEEGMDQQAAGFATAVDAILGDARGWTAAKQFRLRRVPEAAAAEFIIFLATPGTSEKMCAAGGLDTDRFTSCRLPGKVIINVARWLEAVPGYGVPVAVYQAYVVNHEVGHQLGYGHEACPGAGQPAPVMQQQTYGLRGCRANAWPYLGGRRYRGAWAP